MDTRLKTDDVPTPARPEERRGAAPPPSEAGEPPAPPGGRRSRLGIVGNAVHGIGSLLLMAAALAYFGHVFDVVAAVLAGLGAMSLKETLSALRRYLGK